MMYFLQSQERSLEVNADENKKRELDEKMNELMMLYRKRNFNSDSLYDENVINTMTENYFDRL